MTSISGNEVGLAFIWLLYVWQVFGVRAFCFRYKQGFERVGGFNFDEDCFVVSIFAHKHHRVLVSGLNRGACLSFWFLD